jgi:putative transposase
MDSQSVKTVEESSGICGYDAHKHIKGRKRHLLVDTLGIPMSIYVTPADTHDTRVGSLSARRAHVLRATSLQRCGPMRQARGQELAERCQATGDWELEVVERPSGTRGFSVVPRRSRGGTNIQLDYAPQENE